MISRISLLSFKTNLSLGSITEALINMRYTQGKHSGFILLKSNSQKVIAKHVTEITYEREIKTPNGDVEIELLKDYLVNEFEIQNGLLIIRNSTKSLSKFRNDLIKALEFNCIIKSPNIDLYNIIENDPDFTKGMSITSIDVFTQSLMSNTSIKMTINGNGNLIHKMIDFFNGQPFTVKKVTLSDNSAGNIEISQKGNIKINSKNDDISFYKEFISKHIENII